MATQDVGSDYDDDEAPSDLSTTLRIEYVDASKAEGPVVAFERDLPGEDGPWEFTLGRNADAGPQRINDVAIQPDSVGRSHALLKIAADADGGYRTTIELEKKGEVPLGVKVEGGASIVLETATGTAKVKLGKAIVTLQLPQRWKALEPADGGGVDLAATQAADDTDDDEDGDGDGGDVDPNLTQGVADGGGGGAAALPTQAAEDSDEDTDDNDAGGGAAVAAAARPRTTRRRRRRRATARLRRR